LCFQDGFIVVAYDWNQLRWISLLGSDMVKSTVDSLGINSGYNRLIVNKFLIKKKKEILI
jgi:hypothetical protein